MRVRFLAMSAILISLIACTKDFDETAGPAVGRPAGDEKILNIPEGASAGVLAVKVTPAAVERIEQGVTRSEGTRSGVESIDLSLDEIRTWGFARMFRDEPFEADLRAAGLHLWYVARFDSEVDLRRAARALSSSESVAWVEYMRPPVRPSRRRLLSAADPGSVRVDGAPCNDPGLDKQWHYHNTGTLDGSKAGADVSLFDAWKVCSGDESVVVAVLDEPVQYDHPDLEANMWINTFDSDSKLRHGANFTTSTPGALNWNYRDSFGEAPTGHGTHVAGTIAAVNGNGKGVCGIAGGMNGRGGVKIMSCQVFGAKDREESVSDALIWAANRGAHIAQCSLGYSPLFNEYDWLNSCGYEVDAIDYFIAHPRTTGPLEGGLVIFAAGNDGNSRYYTSSGQRQQVKDLRIPMAFYEPSIAVASISPDYLPATYTCYGKWCDISAPGGDSEAFGDSGTIYSTLLTQDGSYGYMEGTSMACPHVSGVAALGLSHAAKLGKRFSTDEFRCLLLSSTDYIDNYFIGTKRSTNGYDYDRYGNMMGPFSCMLNMSDYKGKMGGGLVNAYKVLMAVEGTPVMTVPAGSQTAVSLEDFLGGAAQVMDFSVTDTYGEAQQIGLTCSRNNGKLLVMAPKSGAARLTLKCTIGETKVERPIAIVVRESFAANGGWL